jgi:hypothetical protein
MTAEQRRHILALAADYDTAPTKAAKSVRRAALLSAIRVDMLYRWTLPGGGVDDYAPRAISRWVAASRRAATPTTGKRGRPANDRPHRLDVPATAATRARIEAHAELTGKSRATVAGDALEVGIKINAGEVEDGQ